ncbi:MAG: tetratricopeptide repeat protein [Parvularculaceae bacterium]
MSAEPPSRALIRRWEKSAAAGDTNAQASLGAILATGDGVDADEAGAVYWYAKAALQGDITAKWNLATMILNGEGISKNETYALRMIEDAAGEGQEDACRFLAYAYAEGKFGKAVDADESRRYEAKAEEILCPTCAPTGAPVDIAKDLGVALEKPVIQLL